MSSWASPFGDIALHERILVVLPILGNLRYGRLNSSVASIRRNQYREIRGKEIRDDNLMFLTIPALNVQIITFLRWTIPAETIVTWNGVRCFGGDDDSFTAAPRDFRVFWFLGNESHHPSFLADGTTSRRASHARATFLAELSNDVIEEHICDNRPLLA